MASLFDLDIQRRDALLNAALKEFVSCGYDNASTNVIARESGFSKALMFHYVKNKQELFLLTYDYFNELLDKEYYSKMDYSIKDVFERLRASYFIQIELLKRYPWILNFHKLDVETSSNEINAALAERKHRKKTYEIFNMIDTSRFRPELNPEKCKQFILWANIGFTEQILQGIRNSIEPLPDYDGIVAILNDYLDELRKVFYIPLHDETGKNAD